MSYPCPYCSTIASPASNLKTHLKGQRSSGGHELSADAAGEVISSIERTRAVPNQLWGLDTAVAAACDSAPTLARAQDCTDVNFVASDARWQSELRRRQSRWRESRGYAIGLHGGHPLGSRLAMPEAEKKLWSFLSPAIGELVRREYATNGSLPRTHRKLYGYPRLFADLLSSQPLAFNLFGELALDLARASAAARRLQGQAALPRGGP